VVLCAASFLAVVDTTIVSIALPTIRRTFGFSAGGVQWVLNAYTLVFAGMLLLFGRLADGFGRRRAFVGGLGVFGVGSVLAGSAVSGSLLLAGRFVQGVGAAAFVPSSLSLLSTTFAGPSERSRALGVYGAMAGVGFVVGMVGGGVITQAVGWRGIFWINVPVAAVMLAAAPRVLTEGWDRRQRCHLDVGGAVAVTAGLIGLVYCVTSGPRQGWTSAGVWGSGLAGCAALGAFGLIERRSAAPLAPPEVVARPEVLTANGAVVLESMVGIAWLYLLTLYFQEVHNLDALRSGLLFAPMTAASIAGATIAGRVLGRFGVRRVALAGVGLVAAGVAVMAVGVNMMGGLGVVVSGMVVGEIGFMLCSVALTVAATTSMEDSQAGLAAGLFNTSTQIGGGLGLAAVATVITAVDQGRDVGTDAVQYGFLTCLGFSVLAGALIAGRLRAYGSVGTR
jgi:EmrB/QacA subfamily drug resistance transporter